MMQSKITKRSFIISSISGALFANNSIAQSINKAMIVKVPSEYKTIAEAYNALPENGGIIEISKGIYREKLNFTKPNLKLIGKSAKPEDVVLVWGDSAKMAGGTGKSSSITISGDYFTATNITIQNDYHLNNTESSQAVALYIVSDFAVLNNVRLLGAQDTLYSASKKPLLPSKQYYKNCYIEGHVDFIFGNALAFFDKCHIHFIKKDGAFITAHSRTSEAETTAYVFSECLITSHPEAKNLYLGRAWRPYAQVAFINCKIDANLHNERWREWNPGRTETYKTANFMEYGTKGKAKNTSESVFWSKQLSEDEASKYKLETLFQDISWLGGKNVKN